MRTIAIDDPVAWASVCQSVSDTREGCANTAERIDVLFGMDTIGDSKNIVLAVGPCPPRRGGRV